MYFVFNSQTCSVERHNINSWGEYFYVIFGGAYDNFIDKAHQIVTRTLDRQRAEASTWTPKGSLVESLHERYSILKDKKCLVKACLDNACYNSVEKPTINGWSELINPNLWMRALAYVVYRIAVAVWNLAGASQKIVDMQSILQVIDEMTNDAIEFCVGKRGEQEIVVVLYDTTNSLLIEIRTKERPTQELIIECFSQGLSVRLEEQNADLSSENNTLFPDWIVLAVELLLRENVSQLNITAEIDLSQVGFTKSSEEDGSVEWSITKDKTKKPFHIDKNSTDPILWSGYYEYYKDSYFNCISSDLHLFPASNVGVVDQIWSYCTSCTSAIKRMLYRA